MSTGYDRRHDVAEFTGYDAYAAAVRRGEDPMPAYREFNEQALAAHRGRALDEDEFSTDPRARAGAIMHEVARAEAREHQQARREAEEARERAVPPWERSDPPTRDNPHEGWFLHRDDWDGTRVAGPMSRVDAELEAVHCGDGFWAQRGQDEREDDDREIGS